MNRDIRVTCNLWKFRRTSFYWLRAGRVEHGPARERLLLGLQQPSPPHVRPSRAALQPALQEACLTSPLLSVHRERSAEGHVVWPCYLYFVCLLCCLCVIGVLCERLLCFTVLLHLVLCERFRCLVVYVCIAWAYCVVLCCVGVPVYVVLCDWFP